LASELSGDYNTDNRSALLHCREEAICLCVVIVVDFATVMFGGARGMGVSWGTNGPMGVSRLSRPICPMCHCHHGAQGRSYSARGPPTDPKREMTRRIV